MSLGDSGVFTALTKLNDEATTYTDSSGNDYTPRNLISGYQGEVTAAYALAHSLNAATIELGQMVGFNNVAALAIGRHRHLQRIAHRHGRRILRLR